MTIARFFTHFVFISLLTAELSCGDKKGQNTDNTDLLSQRAAFSIQPIIGARKQGEEISFDVEKSDTSQAFDSVKVDIDGISLGKMDKLSQRFVWSSVGAKMGSHIFTIRAFRKGIEESTASQTVFIRSDISPAEYGYEIVKTYPHNPESFTQGLEWFDGQLYEGTGLNGKSAAMAIHYQTGTATIRKELDKSYFGEGITILGNKLYQITWQNKKGFRYSLPELKLEKEFSYPTDGWGLTNFSNHLAMSDGSNKLYMLDTSGFQSRGMVEVWDNKNPIDALNELEFVNGSIFANKYQTDTLVEFNPVSGKVIGYVDLSNLLPDKERLGNEDVLNGIAYHPKEKLFYVTGKNWPKLFAIRLVRKSSI